MVQCFIKSGDLCFLVNILNFYDGSNFNCQSIKIGIMIPFKELPEFGMMVLNLIRPFIELT